jgi:NAD(P)-dependent dehydrogenase (short-subunit alcohol dehydrogenase family)
MSRLFDKVAIITGAAQGIGLATAELFEREGAAVIACDVKPLGPDGAFRGDFRTLDVTREEAWSQVISDVASRYGHIDVLVNNAGIVTYESVVELTLADYLRVMDVNATSVFLGMREVIPHMQRAGGGSIVNVSSIWGVAGVRGAGAYQASKGAVRTASKNAAITYADRGIRVNSIHPGFIDTPITQAQDPALNAAVVAATPLGRAGTPREIAYGCLFLASDEASFVTGIEMYVDGGYLAQ